MDVGPVESGDGDGAEQAFEALREEVAGLLRGIELVYRQGTEAAGTVVDYSPTLGAIAKELQAVEGRLGAIEAKPALVLTPRSFETEILKAGRVASGEGVSAMRTAASAMEGASREFQKVLAGARSRREQQAWLWSMGGVGVMGGALLWFLLTALLPWGGRTWLGSLAYGGRWSAGQAMIQDASLATWDRMVRLNNACPTASSTALCEAMLTVRTTPPIQPPQEETKAPAAVPSSRPSTRSRPGQQGQ